MLIFILKDKKTNFRCPVATRCFFFPMIELNNPMCSLHLKWVFGPQEEWVFQQDHNACLFSHVLAALLKTFPVLIQQVWNMIKCLVTVLVLLSRYPLSAMWIRRIFDVLLCVFENWMQAVSRSEECKWALRRLMAALGAASLVWATGAERGTSLGSCLLGNGNAYYKSSLGNSKMGMKTSWKTRVYLLQNYQQNIVG